jgi:hypothetical protein
MTNRPLQLKALGQRVWYDTIDRVQLLSRLFEFLIDEDGITGSTANPTIFEHSISHSHVCKEQMNRLISEGKSILTARATAHRQLCKTGQTRALRQRLRISFDGVPGPVERLQPVERVIFLLREVFDDDYPQIAKMVRTPSSSLGCAHGNTSLPRGGGYPSIYGHPSSSSGLMITSLRTSSGDAAAIQTIREATSAGGKAFVTGGACSGLV